MRYDPDELLRAIKRQLKRGSEKEHFDAFKSAINDEPKYRDAIDKYWFKNHYGRTIIATLGEHATALMTTPPRARRTMTPRELREQAKRRARAVEAVRQIVLMDVVLSNGKHLRDCTGAECSAEGGWLMAVGKAVGARNIVGRKIAESDLRNLQKRAA